MYVIFMVDGGEYIEIKAYEMSLYDEIEENLEICSGK